MKRDKEKALVVVGSLRDIHSLGIRVLAYALEQEGFRTANVGSSAEQEDFINAAIETAAKAILVSSSYGMGELDCRGLREKCEEAGLKDILLYAGGNLVVGGQLREWEDIENSFKRMGFNRVYTPRVPLKEVIHDLKQDLGIK